VIGAFSGGEGDQKGAAYIFTRTDGSSWTQQATLLASNGAEFDRFGDSVAISGEYVAVGAPGYILYGVGAVYIFTVSNFAWTELAKLEASDSVSGDVFGFSLALRDGVLLVGAQGVNESTGAAYLFLQSGDSWTLASKLVANDGAEQDRFGVSVDVTDGALIVGARNVGGAYIFDLDDFLFGKIQ